jgi:hypothetical protein
MRALALVSLWWILVAFVALVWTQMPTFRRAPKNYVDLLTDDRFMETMRWKDSAKIVLRTLLLALLVFPFLIAGAFNVPPYDAGAGDRFRAILPAFLVIIPIVAYGFWLIIEAMPDTKPSWWRESDVVPSFSREAFKRYIPHSGVLVTSFLSVSFVAALRREDAAPSSAELIAFLIFLIALSAPFLVGAVVVSWCAVVLVWRHARNAVASYRAGWPDN